MPEFAWSRGEKMAALICGSLAYDTIMVFPERFKDHILPEKVHILNVSFLVPEMRRQFGGVAGNIAYNVKLLGGEPFPMATVGDDFGPYREHLEKLEISTRYVRHLPGEYTPQAFITTDVEDNQIPPGGHAAKLPEPGGRHRRHNHWHRGTGRQASHAATQP
jgi:adenosine kinase